MNLQPSKHRNENRQVRAFATSTGFLDSVQWHMSVAAIHCEGLVAHLLKRKARIEELLDGEDGENIFDYLENLKWKPKPIFTFILQDLRDRLTTGTYFREFHEHRKSMKEDGMKEDKNQCRYFAECEADLVQLGVVDFVDLVIELTRMEMAYKALRDEAICIFRRIYGRQIIGKSCERVDRWMKELRDRIPSRVLEMAQVIGQPRIYQEREMASRTKTSDIKERLRLRIRQSSGRRVYVQWLLSGVGGDSYVDETNLHRIPNMQELDIIADEPGDELVLVRTQKIMPVTRGGLGVRILLLLAMRKINATVTYEDIDTCFGYGPQGRRKAICNRAYVRMNNLRQELGRDLFDRIFRKVLRTGYTISGDNWAFCWIRMDENATRSTLLNSTTSQVGQKGPISNQSHPS